MQIGLFYQRNHQQFFLYVRQWFGNLFFFLMLSNNLTLNNIKRKSKIEEHI